MSSAGFAKYVRRGYTIGLPMLVLVDTILTAVVAAKAVQPLMKAIICFKNGCKRGAVVFAAKADIWAGYKLLHDVDIRG